MRKVYVEDGESIEICVVPEDEPKTAKGFREAYSEWPKSKYIRDYKYMVNVSVGQFEFMTSTDGRYITSRGEQMLRRRNLLSDKKNHPIGVWNSNYGEITFHENLEAYKEYVKRGGDGTADYDPWDDRVFLVEYGRPMMECEEVDMKEFNRSFT